ncbi:MAG TPA: AAA family ATPase [Hyphomicrobiales bacterium]|nr:AAA family ATPase [Hyphomicrobiales bacterium]
MALTEAEQQDIRSTVAGWAKRFDMGGNGVWAPEAPTPPNDQRPVLAPAVFPIIRPAAWQGASVPEREWFVDGHIPARTVTLLSGDGGTGKSLLALQLGAAMALGTDTAGLAPRPGRCLYIGAEDEEAEFHRRLAAIVAHHGCGLADFGDRFHLAAMAERGDPILAQPSRAGVLEPTPTWRLLTDHAADYRPDLVVLDTSADVFAADEIKRPQVRAFITMLRRLAIDCDAAVLLLSHPSLTGINTGSGTSGSTAWSNSVRSRLYLTKPGGEDADPDTRVLTTMKANYGRIGDAIRLRWQDGVFVPDDGRSPAAELDAATAERTFLALLSKLTRQGQKVSPNPSPSYAAKLFAEHPEGRGTSRKQFAAAMQRLLDDGRIKIVEEGPPSRTYKRLLVTAECFGPAASNLGSN